MSYDFPAHESTRKRRRWGCTCGCVMILVVLVIAGALVGYLGFKPHKEFSRYAMMDETVDGFGIIRMNPEDTGLAEFTSYLFRRIEKAQTAQDPASAKVVSGLLKVSKNFVTSLIQPETMIYASYDPETADENVVMSVPLKNAAAWVGIRRLIQQGAGEPTGKEAGSEIYSIGSEQGAPGYLALDNREIVLSDDRTRLVQALTNASDADKVRAPSDALQRLIDDLALDQPLAGQELAVAFLNDESRITNMIHVFEEFIGISNLSDQLMTALRAQDLTFADISSIKLTADLSSADQLDAELTLYSPSNHTAQRLATVFQTVMPRLTGKREGSPFELTARTVARGTGVVVELKLTGLKEWVDILVPVPDAPADAAQ